MMRSIPIVVACLVTSLCLHVVAPFASAELIVIFDNGQARPLADFLGPLQHNKDNNDRVADKNKQLGAANIELLLPIRSVGLTPGKVIARAHNVPFARPYFLIGSDEWSKRWLVQHRKVLKDIGAVGMLVEAMTIEDLQDIATLADGLSITPASGSDIAKAIGIDHYPVGITAGRLWQ